GLAHARVAGLGRRGLGFAAASRNLDLADGRPHRRCRRIALLHPWCPASVSPALTARFPKSSAPTRDEATTRKEFLVAIHVAASLRLGPRPADTPRCERKRARSAGRPPCPTYSATPERKGRDGHRRPPGRGRRRSPLPAAPAGHPRGSARGWADRHRTRT